MAMRSMPTKHRREWMILTDIVCGVKKNASLFMTLIAFVCTILSFGIFTLLGNLQAVDRATALS